MKKINRLNTDLVKLTLPLQSQKVGGVRFTHVLCQSTLSFAYILAFNNEGKPYNFVSHMSPCFIYKVYKKLRNMLTPAKQPKRGRGGNFQCRMTTVTKMYKRPHIAWCISEKNMLYINAIIHICIYLH